MIYIAAAESTRVDRQTLSEKGQRISSRHMVVVDFGSRRRLAAGIVKIPSSSFPRVQVCYRVHCLIVLVCRYNVGFIACYSSYIKIV